MLCVNGYIGIDTLNRYVRYIDELVEYQNIDTIENLKEKDKEIERLNNIINELKQKNNLAENILYDYLYKDEKITKERYKQFKELKEGKQ
jgi:hypothetical protein